MTASELTNRAERIYAESLDEKGISWERPKPKCFRFANQSYTPDFFLPTQNVYIEVIGTRQRWSQLKGKIALFKSHWPNVTLQVVNMSSSDVLSMTPRRGGRCSTERGCMRPTEAIDAHDDSDPNPLVRLRCFVASHVDQKTSAKALGLSASYLSDLLAGRRDASARVLAMMGLRLAVVEAKKGGAQ